MSSRRSLRRRVVLAVTVFRRNGEERQLAHTLDITELGMRLGGLTSAVEPGETIEVQRGALKAKFQVIWMGAAGSAMAGQTGLRSMETDKNIWNVNLPQDETDLQVDTRWLRNNLPPVHMSARPVGEKREHERHPCSGGAAVKTAGCPFAIHGEVKDISQGGIYIEMTSPLPVNSAVSLSMNVEDVHIEVKGVVSTSDPLVGMGIRFQGLTAETRDRVAVALQKARRKASDSSKTSSFAEQNSTRMLSDAGFPMSPLAVQGYPARILAHTCHTLADNFEAWKTRQMPEEVEELMQAVNQLQKKLASSSSHLIAASTAGHREQHEIEIA